jgi:hypothetical protein
MYLPKIILVSQAHLVNKHKNGEEKVLKCNANCYFNKQCILRNLHNYVEPEFFNNTSVAV